MKTFRVEPIRPDEHTFIKGPALKLKYMGGETDIPAEVGTLLMNGRRNKNVFLIDIDSPPGGLSRIRWIGGATNVPRETAQEIASFPEVPEVPEVPKE